MKTTIDISKLLFEEAWEMAEKTGTTFKEVVERALRQLLKSEPKGKKPFKLQWVTTKGNGLVEGLTEGDWPEIRRRAYEGHGG